MKKILIWAGLAALLLLLAIGLKRAQQGQIGVGEMAPDFTLTAFDGEEYHLADFKGQVVVVNFWASWCVTCKPEAEDLESAWRKYQGDVIFLGVDYVDTEKEAKAYLEEANVTYPNGPDKRTLISQAYRVTGVPETFIIDKSGKVAYVQIGPFQSYNEIIFLIEPLLNK